MKFIRKIPMAITGLSLSFASLGNLLLPYGEVIHYICGVISGVILLLFLLKLIFNGNYAREELQNPVVFSMLPTSTMTIMLLSTYIKPYIWFAVFIWYIAVIAHILIMLFFAKRFLRKFKLQNVYPSWFIIGVGIVVASITSSAMNASFLGKLIFYIGLTLYTILLPMIIYRMVKAEPLQEPIRPTIAIFASPMSLCLTSYLSTFEHPNIALVYVMLIVACISYLYVGMNMVLLFKLKFYPTYAAFTFPYVISSIAFKATDSLFTSNGYIILSLISKISEWLAVIVVVYVAIRYMMFFILNKRGCCKTNK